MTGRPEATDSAPWPPRRVLLPRLRDTKIRSKLGLILIIPLIAVVALAAVRLADSSQRAISAELVRSLTEVSSDVSTVAHELHRERMEAGLMLADPESDSGGYNAQTAATDQAVSRYQTVRGDLDGLPPVVGSRLERIDEQLATLENIRNAVHDDAIATVSGAMLNYGRILSDIVAYQESVAQEAGNPDLAESIRALAALAKAKHQMAESQAVAFSILLQGSPDEQQVTSFLATRTGQQEALLAFNLAATPEQFASVNTVIMGGAVSLSDQAAADLGASVGRGEPLVDALDASRAFGAVVNLVRTEETRLHADQVALATQLRDDVFQQVLMESIAVLLALIVAITIAVLLARTLAKSLGRLRQHALAVADRELPETVARLSDPRTLGENTPAQLASQVREPASLRSRDEIGQVAQSFTVVHRAAVRVAAEQAALRTSVSAMFLNLARRSQSLVDRMISQLDEIERNEEDPKRLARMFTLDHLATRMRRNDENLLTLAGADSSPPRSDDALVVDALRAAQSEVEHYDRIEFGTVDSDVSVVAGAVNDVVRLVAELFDNATRFSPPDAPVVCEARRLGDQVILQIEDRGVGMSADQVDRVNTWLASPPAVEVTTFRKMGLAVVARLASRHGIRVELRCDPNFGTVAYVALPRTILILPASRLRYAEIPSPRSPMPAELPPAPASVAPAAPAAPPVPARHLGQLPRRSPAVVHHAANRRKQNSREQTAITNSNPHASGNAVDGPVAGRPLFELTAQSAGSGSAPAAAPTSAPTVTGAPEATVELPIFREMEAVWFRSHGSIDLGPDAPRAGGYPVPPEAAPAGAATSSPAAASSMAPTSSAPGQRGPASGYDTTRYGYGAAPQTATGYERTSQDSSGYDSTRYDSTRYDSTGYDNAGYSNAGYSNAGHDSAATEPWQTAADSGWRAAAAAAEPQAGGATKSGLPKRVPQAQLVPGSVHASGSGSGAASGPGSGGNPNQRRSPEEVRGLLAAYHRGVQRGRESGGGR